MARASRPWSRSGSGCGASRAKIKAVATDMCKAYIKAVRDNLPKAVHVFDHFHVVKLFNDKLSALRREVVPPGPAATRIASSSKARAGCS